MMLGTPTPATRTTPYIDHSCMMRLQQQRDTGIGETYEYHISWLTSRSWLGIHY